MGELIRVPIAKAGKGVFFDVDLDEVNALFETAPELVTQLIAEGLKTVLNSRMSKLAAPSKLEGKEAEENKAAALAKAAENFTDFKAGKLVKKAAGAKAAGVDRTVMAEAVRLAKEVVKNQIRKVYGKVSTVAPKTITEAAKKLVEANPQFIEDAKAAIAERSKLDVGGVDLSDVIKEDPTLVAKAEKAKAERKASRQLSSKQAGKVEKRAGKVPPRRPNAEVSHTAH